MSIIADDAVVLARLDYSESSQVIVLLTRTHGKVRAIAKGVKRSTKARFAVGIDLLEVGHLMVSARSVRSENLATVTEWKQTRPLCGLREKLHRLHGAQYAAEITSHLTEDWDPHPDLFDALVATLTTLSEAAEAVVPCVAYQRALLESIGSMPRFDACVRCDRSEELTHFSAFEGGMICRLCEPTQIEKRRVTGRTLATLAAGLNHPTMRALTAERASLGATAAEGTSGDGVDAFAGPFALLNYHISHMMGREPLLASKLVSRHHRRTT